MPLVREMRPRSADDRESASRLPNRLYLAVEGSDAWRSPTLREQLLDALRSQTTRDANMQWDDQIAWDDEAKLARLSCTGTAESYVALSDAAISQVARAANQLLPGRELVVRIEKASVILPQPQPRHSTRERWGWYAVTLLLEAAWIRRNPEAAAFLGSELPKWERFRTASFAWTEADAVATFSVELVARSADSADGGARDALESLMWAAVKDPGAYELKSIRVEWLSEPPPGTA
jgi:hypothetical protein